MQRGGRVGLGTDAVLELMLNQLVEKLLPALERLHDDARTVVEKAISDVMDHAFPKKQLPHLHKKARRAALSTVARLHSQLERKAT
ncbi:MAG: hypothetical protein MHM6MM_002141 [Cercozoa sp. M6MM]